MKAGRRETESSRCREQFVGIFGNLEVVFGLLSQQQTDTQGRMEARQLRLVMSEGELRGGGRAMRGTRLRVSFS